MGFEWSCLGFFKVKSDFLWGLAAGLVSDAFHLTFGCGLLTFSLFAMAASRRKSDHVYTYGSVIILVVIMFE